MHYLMSLAARRPLWTLAALAALTALAALQLPRLEARASAASTLARDDPAWDYYRKTVDTFGSDDLTVVLLSDPELFAPERLAAIRAAVERLSGLPFVETAASLFSAARFQGTDGLVTTRPFLEAPPPDGTGLEALLRDALRDPLVARNLVAEDGRSMAVNLYLRPGPDDPARDEQVSAAIDEVLEPLRRRLAQAVQIGPAYVRVAATQAIQHDLRWLFPWSLGGMVLVLGLALRRIDAALLAVAVSTAGIACTLGLMGALGVSLSIMSAAVAVLLVIAGSSVAVHLVVEYHAGLQAGLSRPRAVAEMNRKMRLALVVTLVTMVAGFLAVAASPLPPLRELGLVAAAGLALTLVMTALITPAVLSLAGARQPRLRVRRGPDLYARGALAVFGWVERHTLPSLLVLGGLGGLALLAATALRVDHDPLQYFADGSPLRERAVHVGDRLAGLRTFSVVLDSGIEGTFRRVRYLQELAKVQRYLLRTGAVDKTLSFANYVGLAHTALEERAGGPSLPISDDVLHESLAFLPHDRVRRYVSPDYSAARILVRHSIAASDELTRLARDLRAFVAAEVDPAMRVQVTGESILGQRAVAALAHGQVYALGLILIAVLVVVSTLFVNPRAGLVGVLPNLLPVLVLFGVMGALDIPVGSGAAMVAGVALAVSLVHSLHFMARFHARSHTQPDAAQALRETLGEQAAPIIASSLALALGLATLSASTFLPTAHFGALAALVIVLAPVASLLLTPLLVSRLRLITLWDVLALRLGPAVLQDCDLFRGMRHRQIRQVILSSEVRNLAPGESVVRQWEAGDEMYLILAGSVAVFHTRSDGSVVHLDTLGVGSLFGEMALVSKAPRSATVVADEPTQVLVLNWADVHALSRYYPRTAATLFLNLSSVVSERLASMEGAQLMVRDESTGLYLRPFVSEQLRLELARARRYRESFSLLTLEIELASDDESASRTEAKAMRSVSELLAATTRGADILGRWTTRRFAVLLPHTRHEAAELVARRFQEGLGPTLRSELGIARIHVQVTDLRDHDELDTVLARVEGGEDDTRDDATPVNASVGRTK